MEKYINVNFVDTYRISCMGLVCPINSCIITQCAGLDGPKYTARQFSETWNTVKIKISSVSHFTTTDVENGPDT